MRTQIKPNHAKQGKLAFLLLVSGIIFFSAGAVFADTPIYAEPRSYDIYVSADNDQSGDGTYGNPFATLEGARDALRKRDDAQRQMPANVYLRGGTYYLSHALELTKEDSGTSACPITYQAYLNEKVTIRNSVMITGFDRTGNINVANAGSGGNIGKIADGDEVGQVFLNNERLILARFPNYNSTNYNDFDVAKYTQGFLYIDEWMPKPKSWLDYEKQFKYQNETRLNGKVWLNGPQEKLQKVEVVVFPASNFGSYVRKIDFGVNEGVNNTIFAKNKITLKILRDEEGSITREPHPKYIVTEKYPVMARFYVQNIYEELDAEKEWYYDSNDKKLSVYFGQQFTGKDKVTVSLIRQGDRPQDRNIITIEGARNIVFKKLTLVEAEGHGISLAGAEDILINGCRIKNCRKNGINVIAGRNVTVYGCEIFFTGENGVYIGSKPEDFWQLTESGHRVSNCKIHHTGVFYKGCAGIWLDTVGAIINYNRIYNTPRMGISLGGNNNRLWRNYIHDVNRETRDSGAIYARGGSWIQRGHTIEENYIFNTGGYGRNTRGEWVTPFQTVGIYLDEFQSGCTVIGNTINKSKLAGICIHSGRDNNVRDNTIFRSLQGAQADFGALRWNNSDLFNLSGGEAPFWRGLQQVLDPTRNSSYNRSKYIEQYPEIEHIDNITDASYQDKIMVNNKFENNTIFFPGGPPRIYAVKWLGCDTVINNNTIWHGPGRIFVTDAQYKGDDAQSKLTWDQWKADGYDKDSSVVRTARYSLDNQTMLFVNMAKTDKPFSELAGWNTGPWYDFSGRRAEESDTLGPYKSKILLNGAFLRPPEFNATVISKTAYINGILKFKVSADDPDGDTLVYGYSADPSLKDASFDPDTGTFMWVPQAEDSNKNYNITFLAADGYYPPVPVRKVKITVNENSAPTVSIDHANGSSSCTEPVLFKTTFTDINGADKIKYTYFSIASGSPDRYKGLFVYCDAQHGKIGFYVGQVPSIFDKTDSIVLENHDVKLEYSPENFVRNGNSLEITWKVTFKSGFTGKKNIYLYATNDQDIASGWWNLGVWEVVE